MDQQNKQKDHSEDLSRNEDGTIKQGYKADGSRAKDTQNTESTAEVDARTKEEGTKNPDGTITPPRQ